MTGPDAALVAAVSRGLECDRRSSLYYESGERCDTHSGPWPCTTAIAAAVAVEEHLASATFEAAPADPREERLPRWARDALARMRRRVEDAERLATEARLATSPCESDTLLDPLKHEIGLGVGETVRYVLSRDEAGPLRYVDVRIARPEWPGERTAVEVMASGPLRIDPLVSNRIRLEVTR